LESLYRGLAYSIKAVMAQSTRIDKPSIDEQHNSKDAAAARASLRESEELKNLLEDGLRRLENNEPFAANDFQKGAIRALIDLFRMVNGLANILTDQASNFGAEPPARDDAAIKSDPIISIGPQASTHNLRATNAA
jgi:hypothetical protein